MVSQPGDFEHWAASEPRFRDVFVPDRRAALAYLMESDGLLAALPPRPERSDIQQRAARTILAAARRVRTEFLRRHVDQVYRNLTDGHRSHFRLPELMAVAAAEFPGLVPSGEQMVQEARHHQADKEGREIDQGIFAGAVLASHSAGPHLVESMLRPTDRATGLLEQFQRTGEIRLQAARLERRGAVGHLTVTNDHCLNAEDVRHVTDVETLVDLVLLDPSTHVGVMRGGHMTHPRYAGRRVFSAGVNLKELHAGRIPLVEFLLGRELGYISKVQRGLVTDDTGWPVERVQKPWIAAVDTFAIGGGAQLLLVFDRVIAERDAYFSLPAAQEGIVPGVSNLRLTRFLGARAARQVVLWGRRINAGEPDASLLFDDVVDAAEMDLAIGKAAEGLDSPAVVANRRMLNLADESTEDFRRYLAVFAVQQAIRAYSPDVLNKVERGWSR